MNVIARFLTLFTLLAASAVAQAPVAAGSTQKDPTRTSPWRKEILDIAARIPIQDGGRVKPLDTYARFKLLEYSAYRTLSVGEGENKVSLSGLEWLLDVMFFPRQATSYKVFLVEDYDVLSNVGMPLDGLRKRDRYSFEQLLPFAGEIVRKAQAIDERLRARTVEFKQLDPIDQQTFNLALKLNEFDAMVRSFQFARSYIDLGTLAPTLAPEFGDQKNVPISAFFPKLMEYSERHAKLLARDGASNPSAELREIDFVLNQVLSDSERSSALHLFPPPDGEEWMTPGELVARASGTTAGIEKQVELLSALCAVVPSDFLPFEPTKFAAALGQFQSGIAAIPMEAKPALEASKIDDEVRFYSFNFFERAKWIFFGALVMACVLWFAPRSKHLYSLVWIVVVVPLLILSAGITMRCLLRERPPVTTFYETTLFITAVAVIVALVIEWIVRSRIALFFAAVIGYAGMYLAGWYEEVNRNDTMPQLQAVLDTNFWLSTHVTTVTIGYAAGLLAGAIAHAYIVSKLFGLFGFKRDDPNYYRAIGRMVYGCIAFGLVFSTIGTILGGIWANDSWGRFWGWDPKENGALMIVLMNLILVHARIGGFIRDFGLCIGSVLLAIVVNFSWFHVNVLGVGLHSYGFDEQVQNLMYLIYRIEVGFIALGFVAMVVDRVLTQRASRVEAVPGKVSN